MPRMRILNANEQARLEHPAFSSTPRRKLRRLPRAATALSRTASYAEDDRTPFAADMGHTNMLGEYDLTNEKLQDNTGVLPPKSTPSVIPENWEPPKR